MSGGEFTNPAQRGCVLHLYLIIDLVKLLFSISTRSAVDYFALLVEKEKRWRVILKVQGRSYFSQVAFAEQHVAANIILRRFVKFFSHRFPHRSILAFKDGNKEN